MDSSEFNKFLVYFMLYGKRELSHYDDEVLWKGVTFFGNLINSPLFGRKQNFYRGSMVGSWRYVSGKFNIDNFEGAKLVSKIFKSEFQKERI